jgi:hypothetical protein
VSIWAFAIALIIATTTGQQTMEHNDLESFKNRIGFASLPPADSVRGVRADWTGLPAVLRAVVKGKRPYAEDVNPSGSAMGTGSYCWRLKEGSLLIKIAVSGTGVDGARQAFLRRASATTMQTIPYALRTQPLGELAVQSPRNPPGLVMWIYRNVFVHVTADGENLDVEPVAQAIQRFMEVHEVLRLADHVPVVKEVKVSAKEIHVGDVFEVSVVLGPKTVPASVATNFVEVLNLKTREDHLELETRAPLAATFKATKVGQATIDIPVMDRKTLLSPPLSVVIDVLPGR